MEDCIFCKLFKKEAPALSVWEDENTFGFLELSPSSPGHTMIIHKRHGYSIHDYSQKELGEIMNAVQQVAKKIEKALKTDSITIGINHLEKRGMPHLHVHLIPRWDDDGGKVIQGVVSKKSKESREEIAKRINETS